MCRWPCMKQFIRHWWIQNCNDVIISELQKRLSSFCKDRLSGFAWRTNQEQGKRILRIRMEGRKRGKRKEIGGGKRGLSVICWEFGLIVTGSRWKDDVDSVRRGDIRHNWVNNLAKHVFSSALSDEMKVYSSMPRLCKSICAVTHLLEEPNLHVMSVVLEQKTEQRPCLTGSTETLKAQTLVHWSRCLFGPENL